MSLLSMSPDQLALTAKVIVDLVLLLVARTKARGAERAIEGTMQPQDEALPRHDWKIFFGISSEEFIALESREDASGIHIACVSPCEIDYFRVDILLSNFNPFAYVDIHGHGAYGTIVVSLPFAVGKAPPDTEAYEVVLTKSRTCLVFTDKRNSPAEADQFEISIALMVGIITQADECGFEISIPVRPQPYTIGQPWSELRSIQTFDPKPGSPDKLYFPAIRTMELMIKQLPTGYEFVASRLVPVPEFLSKKECRWISRNQNSRSHTSVVCRINKIGARAAADMQRVRGGFAIGLWTAVLVTVAIDLAWTAVALFGTVANSLSLE